MKIPNVLIILDGWGIAKPSIRNAIYVANPVNFNNYWNNYPHAQLKSHGEAVGLPKGEMGNSEVGHLNIGAGKVVEHYALKISKDIKPGRFYKKNEWKEIFHKHKGGTLHLIGLLSPSVVHSSLSHCEGIYDQITRRNIPVKIHLFTDGRDSDPQSAIKIFKRLPKEIQKETQTVAGRYYGMDRDNRWDRTKLAYDSIVFGNAERFESFEDVIKSNYKRNTTDEFIKPACLRDYTGVKPNDSLFMFNFREDRLRQLAKAFSLKRFIPFKREMTPLTLFSLVEFEDKDLKFVPHLYPKIYVQNTISDDVEKLGLNQAHIAESEKSAHITYFFNGGREERRPNEKYLIVPSPKVASYDLAPEMSAKEVADEVVDNLGKYNFFAVNFANPDMVGHTGNVEASVAAVKVVDKQLERIVEKVIRMGGNAYITADHGNAEVLRHKYQRTLDTKHNRNPVPFIYVGDRKVSLKKMKRLADIKSVVMETIKY